MAVAILFGRQRVPMMDAGTLEDRTRPVVEPAGWMSRRLRYLHWSNWSERIEGRTVRGVRPRRVVRAGGAVPIRGALAPRAPVQPGAVLAPRAPVQPGAVLAPRAPVQPGAVLAPRAPVQPGAVLAPRAPVRPNDRARSYD